MYSGRSSILIASHLRFAEDVLIFQNKLTVFKPKRVAQSLALAFNLLDRNAKVFFFEGMILEAIGSVSTS